MDRVYICGYLNYPRGGAGANYVQYLAGTFQELGKSVYIVSNINNDAIIKPTITEYRGAYLKPYQLSKNKLFHYLEFNYFIGKKVYDVLKREPIDEKDLLISYTRDPSILNAVLKVGKKTGAKTVVCLVEWFDENSFEKGVKDKEYRIFQKSFYSLNERYDYILPISTTIEEFYRHKGCKTFRIPCLTDTHEYSYKEKMITEKRIFVFPANGMMKDSLDKMILAIHGLSSFDLQRLEFHVCGAKKTVLDLIKTLPKNVDFESAIVLHDWMEYEELVELYMKSHFLLLARGDSLMTRANFPSKVPETLTYGMIPICSDVGDYTKLYLKDGYNSIYIKGDSSEEIQKSLTRALSMSDEEVLKMSRTCRKTAEIEFDYRNWAKKLGVFLGII